jgi:hypothetical protein
MDAYLTSATFLVLCDILVSHATHVFELQYDKFSSLRFGRNFDSESVWSFVPYSIYHDLNLGGVCFMFFLFCFC